jgi:hypothetical protein
MEAYPQPKPVLHLLVEYDRNLEDCHSLGELYCLPYYPAGFAVTDSPWENHAEEDAPAGFPNPSLFRPGCNLVPNRLKRRLAPGQFFPLLPQVAGRLLESTTAC